MEEDENPSLIFEAEDGGDPLHASDVPLVLTHDGGGTCFAYCCLNPLGRPVYAIRNPHFYSGAPWPGGIPEMARHYVGLVRAAVPRGRLLLGGWSLGGILSLEMARLLADDPCYHVLGIVMVDSVCPLVFRRAGPVPGASPDGPRRVAPFRGQFGPSTKPETIERVSRCFTEARAAVAAYRLPSWPRAGEGAGPGGGAVIGRGGRPPAILLRAGEAVPVEPGEISFVDTARGERTLGWDDYRENLFLDIADVPGHHFNVFAFEHIDNITVKLAEACTKLESTASGRPATVSRYQ